MNLIKLNIASNRQLVVVDNFFPHSLESLEMSETSNITLNFMSLTRLHILNAQNSDALEFTGDFPQTLK